MSLSLKINDYCVYRTHGVVKVVDIQKTKLAGVETKCLVLLLEKEKLLLSIPMKFRENGDIRRLSTLEEMEKAFDILRTGIKKTKGMWSRRAKEYKDKINSGDILQIAEALRDLIRDVEDADRSYSERNIYDMAIYRMASEYAAIKNIKYDEAEKYIISIAKEKIKFSDFEILKKHS
jgi:CarD family transcriptional regulator